MKKFQFQIFMSVEGHIFTCSIIPLFLVHEQLEFQEDLKIRYLEGARKHKELYNKVLELKGTLNLIYNS